MYADRCLRCGQIGHQTGEKACPMYDINPNDGWRKSAEDPMYAHLHRGSLAETDEETVRLFPFRDSSPFTD